MSTPFSQFQLHLVTEPRRELIRAVGLALGGGANWVQLRNKAGSAAAMFAEASELIQVARKAGASVAINDRLDVALAVGAQGIHLAGQSLPVAAVVQLASDKLVIGRSVHGLAELAEIVAAVDVPVLAIGGITVDNLDAVLRTGVAGIAVISAILADADPGRAAARLRAALDTSPHTPRHPFTTPRDTHAAHRQPTTV